MVREKIAEIIFPGEKYGMNWLREDFTYGEALCSAGLEAETFHEWQGAVLTTEIRIKNVTDKPVFTSLGSVGIRLPLQDKYESSEICIKKRCHTHLFCGEDVTYVCALRMGGEAPHFGLVVTEGSFSGYSVERDISKMSNDRGCFLLNPSPMEFAPGEEKKIRWKVFAHEGEEDFYRRAGELAKFVRVEASRYVLFPGESTEIRIYPSFEIRKEHVSVDGAEALADEKDASGQQVFRCIFTYEEGTDFGEKIFDIRAGGVHTTCRVLLHESPEGLAQKRCHFVQEHQQYRNADGSRTGLDGAYLIYDNEEKHLFYDRSYDCNAGRERVGMGLMMTAYLRNLKDGRRSAETGRVEGAGSAETGKSAEAALHESLRRYVDFVFRELVDAETGEVFNDFGRDNRYKRLYNMPWYATLCVELYELYGEKEYLTCAGRIVNCFYERGGFVHYSIEMPVLALCRALEHAGMTEELVRAKALFKKHGEAVLEIGLNYPPFEVKYEQSIVAPAANLLLQLYYLTKEEKWLEAGKVHLAVLELFNSHQPDYHQYETAIRHWDGYWFGKRKLYGDTFPHYWSGLTGNCFALYYAATGEKAYAKRARASLRSVLTMVSPDGTGTCAYVFPVKVNGLRAHGADPYANDQDWAVYFYERMLRELPEVLKG